MKKYISVVLAVVIAFSVAICAYAATLKGDANGDGKITSIDARVALQVGAGLKTCTAAEKKVLDMDNNGKITSLDARKILQTAAGLIAVEKLPTDNSGVDIGGDVNDGQIDWDDIVQNP